MGVQEQVYELVKVHPNFEIRKYPDVICAIATMSESDYSGSSESFQRIAKYIFGQNDRSMKIAMTSPVQRWNDEDGSKMAFIMPPEYQIGDLPSPIDEGVEIVEVPECLTAVLRFSGFSGRRKTESRARRLEALIQEHEYRQISVPILAVYNNPGTTLPFLRRNEIIIPIEIAVEG